MWQNQLHNHSTLVLATNTNTIHRPTSTAHGVFHTDISSYTIEKEPSPNTILIILAWSWVLFKFKNMNNDNENHQKTPRMFRQTYLVGRTNHGTRRRWHAHTQENKNDPTPTRVFTQETKTTSKPECTHRKHCVKIRCVNSFVHFRSRTGFRCFSSPKCVNTKVTKVTRVDIQHEKGCRKSA